MLCLPSVKSYVKRIEEAKKKMDKAEREFRNRQGIMIDSHGRDFHYKLWLPAQLQTRMDAMQVQLDDAHTAPRDVKRRTQVKKRRQEPVRLPI